MIKLSDIFKDILAGTIELSTDLLATEPYHSEPRWVTTVTTYTRSHHYYHRSGTGKRWKK